MAWLKLLTLSQFPKDNTLAHHLWSTAWGQETFAPFDVDVVRDGTLLVDLDEPIPATCQVTNNHPFISKHLKHVVVRNEYVTTLDTLMALSVEVPNSSIIVVGHPGIGKTIFLFYVLIYRLQRGLSTFYQKTAESVLYFHKSGVYSIPANQEPDSVD
ncbi:hypothetical protein SCP_0800290 [Sparassis crispa]|uniref:Uncharacterized protein n=1 Tax=Sparassis crispa TaxID=139825 RepID=A0A401GTG2_9APHY|nr:hypothetical protein SCP_0800290 [Sparassis crispa]GBE85512.1 hypothetical protein SCP_0800290 [Sparassis crispa]